MDNSKSNQELKTGDTVQLKSGGPIMTLVGYDDKAFRCMWFTKDEDEVRENFFPPDSLAIVP